MKARLVHLGRVVVIALALGTPLVHARATACLKKVGLNLREPYSGKDAAGAFRGLHVDVVREALRRMQCDAQFIDMPWNRALRDLQTGQLDMLPGAADTPERLVYALFSKPTNSARNVLFVRLKDRKTFKFSHIADLMGSDFRLAVRRGASYSDEYDALLANPQFSNRLTFVATGESGVQMMAAGRLDGWIADEITGIVTIAQMGLTREIGRSDVVLSEEGDLVAFSRATTGSAFVQRFNDALLSMAADGSFKKYLERYLPCTVSVEKRGCR